MVQQSKRRKVRQTFGVHISNQNKEIGKISLARTTLCLQFGDKVRPNSFCFVKNILEETAM